MRRTTVSKTKPDVAHRQKRHCRSQRKMSEQNGIVKKPSSDRRITGKTLASDIHVVNQIADQERDGDREACEHRPFVGSFPAALDLDIAQDQQKRRQCVQAGVNVRQEGDEGIQNTEFKMQNADSRFFGALLCGRFGFGEELIDEQL